MRRLLSKRQKNTVKLLSNKMYGRDLGRVVSLYLQISKSVPAGFAPIHNQAWNSSIQLHAIETCSATSFLCYLRWTKLKNTAESHILRAKMLKNRAQEELTDRCCGMWCLLQNRPSLSNVDGCQWMNADCVTSGIPFIQKNFWTTGCL